MLKTPPDSACISTGKASVTTSIAIVYMRSAPNGLMAMAWNMPCQYPGPSTRHKTANNSGASPLTKQAAGTAIDGLSFGRIRATTMFMMRPQRGAGRKYNDAVRVEKPRISCRYRAASCSLALRAPQIRNTAAQTEEKGTLVHRLLGIKAGF